jgi:hypothetical protein
LPEYSGANAQQQKYEKDISGQFVHTIDWCLIHPADHYLNYLH